MEFEMKEICRCVIKPSSPSLHLNKLNFSFIDQFNPSFFVPFVYFYPSPAASNSNSSSNSETERVNQLKKSLSEALNQFYPLAARLDNGNNCINCNDDGVIFIESEANCKLLDVLNTNPIIPSQFSQFSHLQFHDSKDVCMVVQATRFNCGGLAIGVSISHRIVDASSFFMFVNRWAHISRGGGGGNHAPPLFNSATIFPPRDLGGFNMENFIVKKDTIVVTKRFLFTPSNIAALRQKYTKESDGSPSPSRIDALSAFIWTRYMVSTDQAVKNVDGTKNYIAINTVNLRKRADPSFPDSYFGNMIWPVSVMLPIEDDKETGFVIAEKLRESINAIDADYVKKLQEEGEQMNIIMNIQKNAIKGDVVGFGFVSYCRFPVYEADFGWGKPMCVRSGIIGNEHMVIFLDTLSGDGIEVWISLSSDDMIKFEADHELLSYVSTSGHDASFSAI